MVCVLMVFVLCHNGSVARFRTPLGGVRSAHFACSGRGADMYLSMVNTHPGPLGAPTCIMNHLICVDRSFAFIVYFFQMFVCIMYRCKHVLCADPSMCYVRAFVCVMCSLQPRISSLLSEQASLRSVWVLCSSLCLVCVMCSI